MSKVKFSHLPKPTPPELSPSQHNRPFLPPPWVSTNDTLRGGSSTSSLTPSTTHKNGALFAGHLDTETLGGAGFAAQFSPTGEKEEDNGRGWDLTGYKGLQLKVVGKRDEKVYTLVLKDSTSSPNVYGLEEENEDENRNETGNKTPQASSFSWEAEFKISAQRGEEENGEEDGVNLWLPWKEFKPTFRGKRVEGGGEWKDGWVDRVGFMMRRYGA